MKQNNESNSIKLIKHNYIIIRFKDAAEVLIYQLYCTWVAKYILIDYTYTIIKQES